MSLDTRPETSPDPGPPESNQPDSGGGSPRSVDQSSTTSEVANQQWRRLKKKIEERAVKQPASEIFGDAAKQGAVYRWGLACAQNGPIDDLTMWLSLAACDAKVPKKLSARIDLESASHEVIDSIQSRSITPTTAASAVIWAAAMPTLSKKIETKTWWELLSALQQLRESVAQRNQIDTPMQLLVVGELGLTLAWRLADLPSCKRLRSSSAQAIERWSNAIDDSTAASIAGGTDARVLMASLIRCRYLTRKTTKKRSTKSRTDAIGDELATWVTALTTYTGSTAFGTAVQDDVADDLCENGLLDHVASFDRDALGPAIMAALGKSQSGGRLAWQVTLPESMHCCEDAKIAVMMPDWDVRRGRTHVDYRNDDLRIEVFGGRQQMLSGRWQSIIEVDQDEQHPRGPWELTCEYSDDDVHYLELEQPWSGGILLQRQFLMIRDDRCLLLADTVGRNETVIANDKSAGAGSSGNIRYISRLPIAQDVRAKGEKETREIFLEQGRNRAMTMPLAACEWRSGLSTSVLESTPDHHLSMTVRGRDRLYAPLWIDFQQRRFKRKRTWRQLTIADERQIVPSDTAAGFRIQVGSEQWMIYRSLAGSRCRSVLGKHLLADFYCGRFDTGDGSIEELITVNDHESNED